MNIFSSRPAINDVLIKLDSAIDSYKWLRNIVEVETDDEAAMALSLQVHFAGLKMGEAAEHLAKAIDTLSHRVPIPFEPKYWVWRDGECEQVEESQFRAIVGEQDDEEAQMVE